MGHVHLRFIFFFALLALAVSCSKPKSSIVVSKPATPPTTIASPAPDNFACLLLTREEVQAVQGEAFKDTKPSEHSETGLIVSQCYFELPMPVNSIVLTVTRKADSGGDPAQSWREIFH